MSAGLRAVFNEHLHLVSPWLGSGGAGRARKAVLTPLGEQHLAAHPCQAPEHHSTFPRSCRRYQWLICAMNCCCTHQVKLVPRAAGLPEPAPEHFAAGRSEKQETQKPGCAQKPSQAGKESGQGVFRSLQDSATEDFLPLETAGRISQPFTKQAEIRRPKILLPGRNQHGAGCMRGEQTWEFTPDSFFHGKGSGDTTRSRVFLLTDQRQNSNKDGIKSPGERKEVKP